MQNFSKFYALLNKSMVNVPEGCKFGLIGGVDSAASEKNTIAFVGPYVQEGLELLADLELILPVALAEKAYSLGESHESRL